MITNLVIPESIESGETVTQSGWELPFSVGGSLIISSVLPKFCPLCCLQPGLQERCNPGCAYRNVPFFLASSCRHVHIENSVCYLPLLYYFGMSSTSNFSNPCDVGENLKPKIEALWICIFSMESNRNLQKEKFAPIKHF